MRFWTLLAHKILRNRLTILISLFAITAVMGFFASKIELSYDFVKILPSDDPTEIAYSEFKKVFGEDGSVMVIGYEDKDLFQLKKFNEWTALADSIKAIKGIQDVLSIGKVYRLERNDSLMKMDIRQVVGRAPQSQEELDSLKSEILSLPFYKGLIYNDSLDATLMAVTFSKSELNSKNRLDIVKKIRDLGDSFAAKNRVDIHYSGLPYIRTEYMRNVSKELKLFMILAVLVTILVLWVFFRTFNAVFYSLIVVIIGVIWSMGTLYLFGYKITILTGLIPPLIVVIGLPNCIFLIIKYQEELRIHGNKMLALTRTIEKVGLSNFLANVTTSIGFFVFWFTKSALLMEFGMVAGINVIATYTIALVFIPIAFSYLPVPSLKATKHLDGKWIKGFLDKIDYLAHYKRTQVYVTLAVITVVSAAGMLLIKPIGYVVDDLPQKDPVYTNLRFFESKFKGVLPFEIAIDTKKENGVFADNARLLYKIKNLQKMMSEYKEFSKPLSITEAVKFAYQGYKDGRQKFYILPSASELKKLNDYNTGVKGNSSKFKAFIDTSRQRTRVSFQMADVGTIRLNELVEEIQPRIDSILDPAEYNVQLTGHSIRFLKSNDYLIHHLFVSLVIAIVLIVLIGIVLFRSISIIVLSKIPCLIPLIMTAGIMGFFDIHIKPSTILVFSIAFGIASDGTIYILTEYRAQLRKNFATNISSAVSRAIHSTGLSMVYTNIILFVGFAIFTASNFGGTVALGILISVTLIVSLVTNLVLLPCILLSLEKRAANKAFLKEPMLAIFDEEEDIDLEKLEIKRTGDSRENSN